jgi:hypothetical protein
MPIERPEYMQMKLSDLPQEFVDLYDLTKIAEDNGNMYIKVQKGMCSLPQAGILAHRLLEQWLNEHGYQQSQITPGLWKHALRPISFMLCIDNFGVKYVCVCFFFFFFLASSYEWVTVMHEIPISSVQTMTSLPYPRTQ